MINVGLRCADHAQRWYFDAVSTTTSESVTIVFFETLPSAFITGIDSFLSLQFAGTRADGSNFVYAIPASDTSVANVTTSGDGALGVWGTTGFNFTGNPTATKYTVTIDNAEFGVKGTFTITSVSISASSAVMMHTDNNAEWRSCPWSMQLEGSRCK